MVAGETLELQRSHTLSDSLKPYASLAVEEAFGLAQALGGDDLSVSEHCVALVQYVAVASSATYPGPEAIRSLVPRHRHRSWFAFLAALFGLPLGR